MWPSFFSFTLESLITYNFLFHSNLVKGLLDEEMNRRGNITSYINQLKQTGHVKLKSMSLGDLVEFERKVLIQMEWLEMRVAFKQTLLLLCISSLTRKEKDMSSMWLSIGFGLGLVWSKEGICSIQVYDISTIGRFLLWVSLTLIKICQLDLIFGLKLRNSSIGIIGFCFLNKGVWFIYYM